MKQLPISRQGATEFTYSRFLVPYLCGFEGFSLFFDEDQIITGDVYELLALAESQRDEFDVWVMQDQQRFEWPSVMLFNNAALTHLTPEFVDDKSNVMFDFAWAARVGALPKEWNHAVGIERPRTDAKLYHFTRGIPYWPECQGLPEDKFWFEAYQAMLDSVDWIDLHRNTRHFGPVMERHLKKYGIQTNFQRKQA